MCVLSIRVPIRIKSGNLFNDPRTYKIIVTGTFASNYYHIYIFWSGFGDLFLFQNPRQF